MQNNRLETFTNRHEAIALFEYLRRNDPNKPWPLLPILTFIAPDGGGKSTLIEYLRARKCCLPNGRASLPYAYLDFTQVDTPRDLLSILIALRNQLQAHADGQGRNLNFPYFDLGAAIALATPRDGELPFFNANDIQRRLMGAWSYFESLNEIGYALGNIVPIILPLLAGLKLDIHVPALEEVLYHLEYSSSWHWYRLHSGEMGLSAQATVSDVLLRLYALSRPGKADKPGREYLVQQVLPAALLADLRAALDSFNGPTAWNETTNVVLFLDGFDTLLSGAESGSTGIRLLEMLALGEHRERGETDPLLLVIGSKDLLFTLNKITDPSAGADVLRPLPMYRPTSSALYEQWRRQLLDDKEGRGKPCPYRLRELCLPLELQNFELDDTTNYLLKTAERVSIPGQEHQTTAFTVTGLVQAIHDFTRGHPLYLALAAASVLEAEAHNRNLDTADFIGFEDDSPSSFYQDVSIAEYLCSLYLHQLSGEEEDNLIFCAVPRMLDIETLQIILQLPTDDEIQKQWNWYRSLPFVRTIDNERIVFHPVVRNLLLQRLSPTSSSEKNYHGLNTRLREYFHRRDTIKRPPIVTSAQDGSTVVRSARIMGNEYARIEEAYHALAVGDSDPAISLALFAQRVRLALWEPLLDAISEAPTALMPAHTEQQAANALATAMQYHRTQDIVVAIVLYTWLLTASREDRRKVAEIQNNLGAAYWTLASGDRQSNLEKAIACYQAALQVYTSDAFPADWATTQNNLGAAYWTLASIGRQDRQTNLEKAIACSKGALQVYTRTTFPADWARTQFNLARAYHDLPDENRQENLEKAIACYEATLQVYTREDFPAVWAKTYDSLGNAYLNLPGENRQENLQKAIDCYNAALEVYTQQSFPVAWARVQHRLGDAYRDLTNEDPQEGNLKKAIAFYQGALQVYTRDSLPGNWAEAQDSLGYTYASLLSTDVQDRRENLEKAIACYQAALQVYTSAAFPSNWASTQNNLGYAYAFLPGVDRRNEQESLEKAIGCYEGALQVFSSLQMDDYIQLVSNNLADAQERLQQLGQAGR